MATTSNGLSVAITGASRGIGLATARSLKSVSSEMALIASSQASFSNAIREEFGASAKFYAADFASAQQVERLAAELREGHRHFDVLVNNCGLYVESPFSEAKLPELDKMIDVNVKAPIALTRLLLDQLKNGKNSIVINMSSIQAKSRSENLAVYAATKAGLSAFSDALRKELNPLGIRVTVLEPSGVNTWGAENSKGLLSPEEVGELVKTIATQNPTCQIHEVTLSGL